MPLNIGNTGTTDFIARAAAAAQFRWLLGVGEQMRLNSTGLGIGNSNPEYKLDVAVNQANTTVNALRLINSNNSATPGVALLLETINPNTGATISNNYIGGPFYLALSTRDNFGGTLRERYRIFTNNLGAGVYHQWFRSDGAEAMRLDVSGNLGLGVTPNNWTVRTLQTTNNYGYGALGMSHNGFFDGGWKYITSAAAAVYQSSGGSHIWYNAAAGIAGNAITLTQAMTLDASGNLVIGATSAQAKLHVAAGNLALSNLGSGLTGSTPAAGTQKLVLGGNSSNGVGSEIGWYTNTSFNGDIAQITAIATAYGSSSAGALLFRTNLGSESTPSERMRITNLGEVGIGTNSPGSIFHLNVAGGGDAPRIRFTNGTTGTGATDGSFIGVSNSLQLDVWNFENDVVRFGTNNAERMRIDANGNVIINTAAIATNATNGFLYVPSCAGVPTGVPTTYTGRIPMVVDSTNNHVYFYIGGNWRYANTI